MTDTKYFQNINFYRFVLFMGLVTTFLIAPQHANAGAPGYESTDMPGLGQTSQVTVTLRGAERQGVVQIVDYLLSRFPEVVAKEEGELHVVPGSRGECLARWEVTVKGISGMDLDSKIMATINSLDLQGNNDIFYESPFIIVAQDLEKVKQIKSRKASEKDVMISLLPGDFESFAVTPPRDYSYPPNPWLQVPGAGFE